MAKLSKMTEKASSIFCQKNQKGRVVVVLLLLLSCCCVVLKSRKIVASPKKMIVTVGREENNEVYYDFAVSDCPTRVPLPSPAPNTYSQIYLSLCRTQNFKHYSLLMDHFIGGITI